MNKLDDPVHAQSIMVQPTADQSISSAADSPPGSASPVSQQLERGVASFFPSPRLGQRSICGWDIIRFIGDQHAHCCGPNVISPQLATRSRLPVTTMGC